MKEKRKIINLFSVYLLIYKGVIRDNDDVVHQLSEKLRTLERIADSLCKGCGRSTLSKYARMENEPIADFLERLIAVEAPIYVRANVQAILEAEPCQATHQTQTGKIMIYVQFETTLINFLLLAQESFKLIWILIF